MTAPHKFRVWDGEDGEMHESPHEYAICADGAVGKRGEEFGIEWHPPDLESMFYTGLTDAEGTEIYEGDIIENDGTRFVVEWDEEGALWSLRAIDGSTNVTGGTLTGQLGVLAHTSTVVGNRYEHAEMVS